ncbi:MAG: response regulator [Bacteroidales bacterium]|nr:response regulator [Bacteroidales bacterium]MBS3774488.1 response regulator [Bacteroidales bacterium]
MIKRKATQNDNHSEKPVNWQDKTILIVEDDPLSIRFLNTILKETGANLLVARSGREALDMVMQHDHLDLILMDVQLPVMSGHEVTSQIRENGCNIPIIAQTAHAMAEDRAKCLQSGCSDYITKPIDIELLIEKISKYFQE